MRQFFDTNVLVYSQDPRESAKREVARGLIQEAIAADAFVTSTQVMVEFYATCLRRNLIGPAQALGLVQLWIEHDTVPHTPDLVVRALALHQAHSVSVWDALVVQAALDARCDMVLSEDLQQGRRFGDLLISNPFLSSTHEPAHGTYTAGRRRGARRPGRGV